MSLVCTAARILKRVTEGGVRRRHMATIMTTFVRYGIYFCEDVKRAVAVIAKGQSFRGEGERERERGVDTIGREHELSFLNKAHF